MKLKVVIVDDEQLARQLLKDYVARIPGLELVGECKNALETLKMVQDNEVDLLLLDIQMPDLTGIDLLKVIKHKPSVIFTTAYQEFAIEGYELDVVDYLLKPIAFERFVQAVNKVNTLQNIRSTNETLPDSSKYITLKADHRIYKVLLDDISHIEGLREYVTFHTRDKKIIVLESLKKLEEQLPPSQFKRVHKSFIVNTTRIDTLYGNQLELGELKIPIGQSYKEEVLKLF